MYPYIACTFVCMLELNVDCDILLLMTEIKPQLLLLAIDVLFALMFACRHD